MTEYRDLIPVIVERENATLPDGFDSWGLKSVRPDFRTRGGYQWPFPGSVAVAERIDTSNTRACPSRPGDGLCVGLSWRGMASGGISARTLLLVAYRAAEVAGASTDEGKLRTRTVAVVSLIDGERLLREAGSGASLSGAGLSGASLYRAKLSGADLSGADLSGADLSGASLSGARLSGASLYRASLYRASLSGASLSGAGLSGASLSGADLSGASLYRAKLYGAVETDGTVWPAGFSPSSRGVVFR